MTCVILELQITVNLKLASFDWDRRLFLNITNSRLVSCLLYTQRKI